MPCLLCILQAMCQSLYSLFLLSGSNFTLTEIKKQGLLLFFDVISKLQEVLFSAEPVVLDNNIVNSHYPEMPRRTAAVWFRYCHSWV